MGNTNECSKTDLTGGKDLIIIITANILELM
jgi:hypothetical protein